MHMNIEKKGKNHLWEGNRSQKGQNQKNRESIQGRGEVEKEG